MGRYDVLVDRAIRAVKGAKQDKDELVALLEKHKGKLPKADQTLVETIKERKHDK